MKAFIFFLLVGLAYSSLMTDVDRVLEKITHDVKIGSRYAKSLKETLEAPDSKYLDKIEDDMKDYALNLIREHFGSAIRETVTKVHKAESEITSIEEHIKRAEHGLTEIDSIKRERSVITAALSDLIDRTLGERGTQLKEDVEEILKKITNPQKLESQLVDKLTSLKIVADIRKYIENTSDDVEKDIGLPLKEIAKVLSDSDIQDMLRYILTPRHERSLFDFFDKIKKFFKDLGTKISSKFSQFSDWAQDHYTKAIKAIKAKSGPITALAKEFISHAKDVTKAVAKQALSYFMAHKAEIAKLVFTKALSAAKAALAA